VNKIFKEVEDFGFTNGNILFGDYTYSITLVTVRVFSEYVNLLLKCEDDNVKGSYDAFQHICNHCLYREVEEKNIYQKLFNKPGKIVKLYDFKLDNYPKVLCSKFIDDMYKVLVDETFFQRLLEWGAARAKAEQEK